PNSANSIMASGSWAIFKTERQAEAEILLSLYPDNILMSYLRIKSTLKEDDELIKQLNLIFVNDANFLKFKI
ncbi:heme biosynthesis protein HemY, partial [Acinetobacter nosocomialis]|nr:heme biosynthesis protein HemY [Acinetobacter nosocomialis]